MNDKRSFDPAKAEYLIGKYVLVGITYFTAGLTIEAHKQVHGVITGFHPERGLKIELKGWGNGQEYWLPPQTQSFKPAAPGTYKLANTDEEIIDPDFIALVSMVKKTGGDPMILP